MLSKIKNNYFLLISTFLILYFFFNLLDGERGLFFHVKKNNLLQSLQNKEIELFPNLINTGGTISIRNLPSSQNLMTAKLFNAEGKMCTSIVFEKNGDQMISSPIDMEPGLYYIRVNNSSFRLIII